MKLAAQDYRSALDAFYEWDNDHGNCKSYFFESYCKDKIKELEKPENPQYKCIKEPIMYNNGTFELGKIYNNYWRCCGFSLLDLPNHFELVVPEPEPAKITWEEVGNLIESFKRQTFLPQGFYIELKKILNRIKTDHL